MDKAQWDRAANALRGYFVGLCFTLCALVLSYITRPLIGREGPFLWGMVAIICTADDDVCLDGMYRLLLHGPAGRWQEVTLTRHWLGFASEPRNFMIATVPPRS